MTNQKSTKKALLSSVISLILCLTMLIGTTFAWFTDSVTSANNRIVAGNLDVEMFYKNTGETSWINVTTPTEPDFFKDINGDQILWEPGAVAYANFKVENKGSLALKYSLQTIIDGYNTIGGKSLGDALTVKVVSGEKTYANRQDAIDVAQGSTDTLESFAHVNNNMAPNATDYFTVILYWEPTGSDNAFNASATNPTSDGEPLWIDIELSLVATQAVNESDSFDNTYDANALYYDALVTNTAELEEALKAGKKTIAIKGVITLEKSFKVDGVTFVGFDSSAGITFGTNVIERSGASITYKNLILDATRVNSDGTLGGWYNGLDYANGSVANYIDCKITNGITTYATTVNFTNCSFSELPVGKYSLFMYGSATVNAKDCTFYYGDRAIKIYSEGAEPVKTMNLEDCKFVKGENFTLNKALVEVDDSLISKVTVNINGAIVDTNLGDVEMARVNDGVESAKTTVVVDGVTQTTVKTAGTAADLQEALNQLSNGETVILTKDIDLSGSTWDVSAPWQGSGTAVVFDGDGHTIKGLTTSGSVYGGLFGRISTNGNVTIQNLTIEGANISGTDVDGECAGGALLGWFESHGGVLTVENVKVVNANVKGFKYVGGLIGYTNTDYAVNITNCSVNGTALTSTYNESGNYKGHIGGLVGYYGKGTITGSSVSNLTIKRDATDLSTSSNRAGALVGTITSNCVVASATVSDVTVDGAAASSDNVFGPNASATSVSKDGIVIK